MTNDKDIISVAYCRVSTEAESQLNSFNAQVDHYQKLFINSEGKVGNCGALYQDKVLTLKNNGIYADEGISGAKAYKNRQAFMKMIEDAKMGLFNKIYCKNIYRFSRDVEAGAKFIKDLRETGVEVYFEDGGLSTKDPQSDLVINMMLSVGQEESRAKSAAVQWGVRKKQKDGKYHAKPSYGYDLEDGYLSINETESEVIKNIYKMYLEDEFGQGRIARELINNNIPTKKGGQWSAQHVKKILTNPIYMGKQVTNVQNVNALARFKKESVPEEKQIINYYDDLIIIDEDTFRRVQERFEKRAKDLTINYKSSTTHVLSNLIKCGNCGGGYGRKKRKGFIRKDGTSKELGYEWVCKTNDNYGKGRCDYRNAINEDELINEIKDQLRIWKKDPASIQREKELYLYVYHDIKSRQQEKKDYDAQLEKLQKQVQLNFELLGDGIIDKEEYRTRNDKLQTEIKDIKKQMLSVINIDKEILKVEKDFAYYMKIFNNINIDELTNAGLKKVIDRIVVTTDSEGNKSHQIEWKFLNKNTSQIGIDATMKAMIEDHYDMIPPEFRNKVFRA